MPAPRCRRAFPGSAASAARKLSAAARACSGRQRLPAGFLEQRRPGIDLRDGRRRPSQRGQHDGERQDGGMAIRLYSRNYTGSHRHPHGDRTRRHRRDQDGSRRPIEPTLESDLVADLGFDSLQVMEMIAELEGPLRHLHAARRGAGHADGRAGRRAGDALVEARGAAMTGPLRTLPEALAEAARSNEGYMFVDGRRRGRGVRTRRSSTPRSRVAPRASGRGSRARRSRRADRRRRRAVPDGALRRVDRRPRSRVAVRRRPSRASRRAISSSPPASSAPPAPAPSSRARALVAAFEGAARELSGSRRSCCRGDDLDAPPLEPGRRRPSLDDIAFVQFTSGSTSAPKGRRDDASQPGREHRRHQRSRRPRDHLRGFRRELAAALPRHGTRRHGARPAVFGAAGRADDAADVRQAAGRMAAGDFAASRDGQLRAELRLRPGVRRIRDARSGRARPVLLARRRLRRRTDSRADARGVRRATCTAPDFARRAFCRATAWPSTCSPRRCRRAAGRCASSASSATSREASRRFVRRAGDGPSIVSCGRALPGHDIRIVGTTAARRASARSARSRWPVRR